MVTVRYWAAAQAAAGVEQDQARPGTVAEVVSEVDGRHGPELARVTSICSVLVDGVVVRGERSARMVPDGSVVELLPPFAGG